MICSTGDVLHFGLAKEQTSVSNPEIPTHLLIVGDDVAVTRTQGSITGRRGLAGTVLVHKTAGAAASQGSSLDKVKQVASFVSEKIGTIGSGLGHCSLPGSTGSGGDVHLKSDEIEIGMGESYSESRSPSISFDIHDHSDPVILALQVSITSPV